MNPWEGSVIATNNVQPLSLSLDCCIRDVRACMASHSYELVIFELCLDRKSVV